MKKTKKKAVKVKKKVVKSIKKKTVKKTAKKKKAVKKTAKKKKAVKKAAKKKTVKKKVAKKKTVKKTPKKRKTVTKAAKKKKTLTRKKRKKISMEDIYSIINKVQFGKKKITFATELNDAPIIENNLKDVELKYNKVEMKTQAVFTLYPNNKRYEEDMLHLEMIDDEIPDIEQIFG
jgi:hypothetical protein